MADLPTQAGLDYTKLRDLLAEGKFQDADDETRALLIKLAGPGAVERKWVYFSEVRTPKSVQKVIELPCTVMRESVCSWTFQYSFGGLFVGMKSFSLSCSACLSINPYMAKCVQDLQGFTTKGKRLACAGEVHP